MRSGWNPDLERLLHRADPAAGPIVHAVAVGAEDVRERRDEFLDADTTLGFQVLDGGGVRLSGGGLTLDQSITENGQAENLEGTGSSVFAALVEWKNSSVQLHQVRIKVVARVDGLQPVTVKYWKLRLYRIASRSNDFTSGWELQPLAEVPVVEEVAGSTTPYVIDFDLPRAVMPAETEPEGTEKPNNAAMVVVLSALTEDGAVADNCGWRADTSISFVDGDVSTLSGILLIPGSGPEEGRFLTGGVTQVPYIELVGASYVEATIGFTGANLLDLGAAPGTNDVELIGQGESPGDTGIVYEISDDGVSWLEFDDGDFAATDNTPRGGRDLSALAKQQTYEIRATLTPGGAGRISPTLRRLGARAVAIHDLRDVATVRSLGYGIDPLTLKAEIAEATIEVIRSGEWDYRDVASDLVSENFIGGIEFRVYIGSSLLPQHQWLHVDTLLVDDYDTSANAIVFTCVGVLAQARAVLPPLNEALMERAPLELNNVTLKAAYDELVNSALGLPERYRGPGIEDDVTTVSKTIAEETDGKDELDALARIAGGSVISSQGRIKFVDVLGEKAPVASFARGEVRITGQTPGMRSRVPEFFVPWGWNEDAREFTEEVRSVHANALTRFGSAQLDPPGRLDDIVARWIDSQTLAESVGAEHTRKVGAGVIQIAVETTIAFPHLEPGDAVAVPLDGFVARDPDTERQLRGRLWAIAVVQQVHDVLGRSFTLWVRSYADFFSSEAAVVRDGLAHPTALIFSILSFDPIRTSADGRQVTYRGICGTGVEEVWVHGVLLSQPIIIADPWSFAEDHRLPLAVLIPDGDNAIEYTFDVPADGKVFHGLVRPYHVHGNGGRIAGPAWNVHLDPLPASNALVNGDDTETGTQGYYWIKIQPRGIAESNVTYGTQVDRNGGAVLTGQTPTRTEGDTSVVTGEIMGAGEYEVEISKGLSGVWVWFDIIYASTDTQRIGPILFAPNATPVFLPEGPTVVGTRIFLNVVGAASVNVVRTDGAGTWEIDRDSVSSIDVSGLDDAGNAGLTSGSGSYTITAYSDATADRGPSTLSASTTVGVVASGSATHTLDLMTLTAPLIDNETATLRLQASSATPHIDTRRRYRVNGGAWESWVSVPTASPNPAPTATTDYFISGLPTRRELTGELVPPQYQVDVEVECTLTDGSTDYAVVTRTCRYTTNASDV